MRDKILQVEQMRGNTESRNGLATNGASCTTKFQPAAEATIMKHMFR
jgi:hypothetical protein